MAAGKERLVAVETRQGWRPRAYLKLSRLLPPRSFGGKMLVAACVAVHIPLIALVVYLLRSVQFGLVGAVPVLLVAFIATLLGTAFMLLAPRSLLAPVSLATRALRLARQGRDRPALPTDLEDEGGRLLAETQHTLDYFETVIKQLELEATTDELTGMLNRRAGERRLRAALDAYHLGTHRLAVVLLDVDGLKTVNDRWGHAAGDAALAHLATALAQHVGAQGWVARWGGDEFLVVLAEKSNGAPAKEILAAVAREVAATPLPVAEVGETRLGISWGLAWPAPGEGTVKVIGRADAALYRAKQRSRSVGPGKFETSTA